MLYEGMHGEFQCSIYGARCLVLYGVCQQYQNMQQGMALSGEYSRFSRTQYEGR